MERGVNGTRVWAKQSTLDVEPGRKSPNAKSSSGVFILLTFLGVISSSSKIEYVDAVFCGPVFFQQPFLSLARTSDQGVYFIHITSPL